MGTLKRWATPALIVLLVILLGAESCRLRSAQREAALNALRADSTAAAADQTRKVGERAQAAILKVLGDSLNGVERRAIQQQQRADALDRALGRERIARVEATARVAQLETILAGAPVREDSTARVADFTVRQAPYTVTATATLPRPPLTASLRLGVTLDPIPLHLRLGCGPADRSGIRPASATLIGPTWADLQLGTVEQSPDLCHSPALTSKGPSRLRWALFGAVAATAVRWFVRSIP